MRARESNHIPFHSTIQGTPNNRSRGAVIGTNRTRLESSFTREKLSASLETNPSVRGEKHRNPLRIAVILGRINPTDTWLCHPPMHRDHGGADSTAEVGVEEHVTSDVEEEEEEEHVTSDAEEEEEEGDAASDVEEEEVYSVGKDNSQGVNDLGTE